MRISPEQWINAEDKGCREGRIGRLKWVRSITPPATFGVFPGGWMAKALFDEATYCFVYAQFVASVALGVAYIERTLAGMLYAAGLEEARRGRIGELVDAAVDRDWLTPDDRKEIEQARGARNPIMHFRTLTDEDTIEHRSVTTQEAPYDLLEQDARHVLDVAYRLYGRNAAY